MSSITPRIDALIGKSGDGPSSSVVEVKLLFQPASGQWKKAPARIKRDGGRIMFVHSDRLLKNTVKAMADSKWHAEDVYWSIADSSRNRFQLEFLLGGDPYAWFERPLVKHEYKPRFHLEQQVWLAPFPHQAEDADRALTYHFLDDASEMGCGKSLARILHMEQSGITRWWWVTRASLIGTTQQEFHNWQLDPSIQVEVMSYDAFLSRVSAGGYELVQGIVFDEGSALKNPVAKRSIAALKYTDEMRTQYGHACHVVVMSGTPSPENPAEWWNPCEIIYPGYLKEGSRKALEQRLGIFSDKEFGAGIFKTRVAWKDNIDKCVTCGLTAAEHDDDSDPGRVLPATKPARSAHEFKPIKNEVAYLNERLKGLVFKVFKKDVLSYLPEKTYRTIYVKPAPGVLRAAKLMVDSAESAIQALTKLRELSDGFQYVETPEGRKTEQIVCPKDQVLADLLAENYEVGRLLVFGGFDGTLDRIQQVCQTNGWAVVRCDGGGIRPYDAHGQAVIGLDWYKDVWKNRDMFPHVVWDANPESGGLGFTLVEAMMAFFYSNTFKPEYRTQSEARHHRPGMDTNKGGIIVDVVHLPVDEQVIKKLKESRKLEKMTLGELSDSFAAAV